MSARSPLDRLVYRLLPPALRSAAPDTVRRARLCVVYCLGVPVFVPPFAVLLWLQGEHMLAAVISVASVAGLPPILLLRRTGSLTHSGHLMAAESAVMVFACSWLEGGLSAPSLFYLPLVPITALVIAGRRPGLIWFIGALAVLLVLFGLEQAGIRASHELSASLLAILRLALAVSAVWLFFFMGSVYESLKTDAVRELETANEALARARDQAEAATRAKSAFLAMMSHEMRSPLHGIFGMTELALDTRDEGERRELVQRARACAETLLTIINDVLDFSRIEAGRLSLQRVEFDVRDVVEGVLDTLSTEVLRKELDLVGCVEANVPRRVVGDPGRLRQLLLNLAGNAVKFTERGEVVIRLEGGASGEPGHDALVVRGHVRDTGVGVARDQQTAIFEAFAQADSSMARPHGGTGLGLAIARQLVRLMDGTLGLESAPGHGSRFFFSVELGRAPVPPPAPTLGRACRVLLIEPRSTSRRHLVHTLGEWGCAVTAVVDGDAARSLIAEAGATVPFDLVLLDVDGPAADRIETLRWVEALGPGRGMPVVGIGALGFGSGETRCGGMSAVVSRPVKTSALLAAVRAALALPAPAETAARPPARLPAE